MVLVSFKPTIPESFCSTSESNEENPRDRTLDLSFFFHYKYITSLKSHFSLAQGESLPCWFRGDLLAKLLSFL